MTGKAPGGGDPCTLRVCGYPDGETGLGKGSEERKNVVCVGQKKKQLVLLEHKQGSETIGLSSKLNHRKLSSL